jgi:hypothetical protein
MIAIKQLGPNPDKEDTVPRDPKEIKTPSLGK